MIMTDIKSMTQEEMTATPARDGRACLPGQAGVLPGSIRARPTLTEMTNLSKPLREKLGKELYHSQRPPWPASRFPGSTALSSTSGSCATATASRRCSCSYHHGNTVCISSQVGCRMGCAFCASTIAGKVRDLTPSEMLDQVLFTQLDSGLDISNIVLMGIGEPLDNLRRTCCAFWSW